VYIKALKKDEIDRAAAKGFKPLNKKLVKNGCFTGKKQKLSNKGK
jgi:hypothetical protein